MTDPAPLLPRAFFDRPVLEVAADLLGRQVVSTIGVPAGGEPVAVRLTEVEAYAGGDDPGSHAYRGPTRRTAVMFGPGGHVYVYFTYGMHWCANLVCGPVGRAAAVLLRAGEVVSGADLARARRPSARVDRDLTRGPARLAAALGLDGSHDGLDCVASGSPLQVRAGAAVPDGRVRTGPRVGVAGEAGTYPWRFWADGEPTVSTYRRHAARRRTGAAGPAAPHPAVDGPGAPHPDHPPRPPHDGRPTSSTGAGE